MASLLRQLVAGPRARHPESNLDLCYVTPQIIATSGPSGTYPQRAYRNPLDQLVKFLDDKHGAHWAIWEFRAEGMGYPDSEVYGRVWHYPWPDHHPPPFGLVPMIMGGMRNWLGGGGDGGGGSGGQSGDGSGGKSGGEGIEGWKSEGVREKVKGKVMEGEDMGNGRVVVVHCKAGKGRSGTMVCSYLISECGWTPAEALARFTERRMRPGFGQGVSIPSQLRWIGYVDRWTKGGKIYVERQMEVLELHVWGLRDGVKVQVEGFVDEGKTIKLFHVFSKKERVVVEGNTPGSGGLKDKISDAAGFQNTGKVEASKSVDQLANSPSVIHPTPAKTTPINAPSASSSSASLETTGAEEGGGAVIFKPAKRVVLPTSDINIDFERRNKASMGWTMVTAVAHVWFNTYFEGQGPEQGGKADESGVFEIEWDAMDGIKGSSRKGTRAFDRMAVVWKAYDPEPGRGRKESIIREPGTDSPVPQMAPADWKGGQQTSPGLGKDLGLRTESPASADVSKASSMKSNNGKDDTDSEVGVRTSGPGGEEELENVDLKDLPHPEASGTETTIGAVNAGLDTASATTEERGVESSRNAQSNLSPTSSTGVSMIPTSELPDGVPEDQMRDVHDHKLGHLKAAKKVFNS